jgi:hypothetical protein
MMYRIINGLVAIEPPPFMHHLGAATRGQQHKYTNKVFLLLPLKCRAAATASSH